MFNKDFYPTPEEVINEMLIGVDVAGKTILEPSAGSGNIVDVLNQRGAQEVLTFEKEPALADHVKTKSKFIGSDFLQCTEQQISHVDLIVMNPPFSRDEQHILHAWEIAPDNCTIISLLPDGTLTGYNRDQKRLQRIVKDYCSREVELEDCFSTAERKTNVGVSLIQLHTPIRSSGFDFENAGLFLFTSLLSSIRIPILHTLCTGGHRPGRPLIGLHRE